MFIFGVQVVVAELRVAGCLELQQAVVDLRTVN
jgi:hypothetical protein